MAESASTSLRYANLASCIAQFVHEHIDEAITIDMLAREAAVSKYHLNRIFQSITGLQLGQYIQTRRLGYAYELLASKNTSVIEAGLAVGYESHSSFTRAFTKAFGHTPSEVKIGSAPSYKQPKAKHSVPGVPMEPQQLELPERRIVGLYGQGFKEQSFIEIATELYGRLDQDLEKVGIRDFADRQLVGVSIDSPWRGNQELCRYFAGIDLDVTPDIKHLNSYAWKAGSWAKFVHHGPYRFMWQTISQIYSGWVIPNQVNLRDAAIIQIYVNNPQDTDEDNLETHLYFCIQP